VVVNANENANENKSNSVTTLTGADEGRVISANRVGEGYGVVRVFDAVTRAAAAYEVAFAFPSCNRVRARAIANALIDETPAAFRAAMTGVYENMELCNIWESMCAFQSGYKCPLVAACIVDAFVRAGLRLQPPFAIGPVAYRLGTMHIRSPLCVAAMRVPTLAEALLDLPLECGLDVNYIEEINSTGTAYVHSPAIGGTNGNLLVSPRCFQRLLERTDRAIITAGAVFVNCGRHQMFRWKTHVLISNIFRCAYPSFDGCAYPSFDARRPSFDGRRDGTNMARAFISAAQADGGGTDLTGGVAHHDTTMSQSSSEVGPINQELFPNGKFLGALPLLNTILGWWQKRKVASQATANRLIPLGEWCQETGEMDAIIAQLQFVQSDLLLAMRRLRLYRRAICNVVSNPLGAADMHARELHELVTSYVLTPLHDESQLDNPLLLHSYSSSTSHTPASTNLLHL
jgi:hypothetical protein